MIHSHTGGHRGQYALCRDTSLLRAVPTDNSAMRRKGSLAPSPPAQSKIQSKMESRARFEPDRPNSPLSAGLLSIAPRLMIVAESANRQQIRQRLHGRSPNKFWSTGTWLTSSPQARLVRSDD